MAYKEVSMGTVHQFEKEGDVLEGTLAEVLQGEYGNNYAITKADGERVTMFGSTVINSKMAIVKVGDKVKITFLGMPIGKNSKRQYKDFKVEIDK